MVRKLIVPALILALCVPSIANAQAVTGFSGGFAYDSYYGLDPGDTIGWSFTVNDPIMVTDLGAWIDADGMQANHDVGIWDGSHALIASATVTPASTPVAGFNYESIAGVMLMPGEDYVIGAAYGVADGDSYISSASSMTTAPEVNWLQSRYPLAGGMGFAYPDSISTSFGRFGPNFLFVPEPGALVLLSLGGLALLRRR